MHKGFRTWCEINLSAISYNLQQVRKRIGKNRLIAAVVKADAYGHGIHEVAQSLSKTPQLLFAVATPDEGIALRKTIHDKPILILSCIRPHELDTIIETHCIPTVAHYDVAKKLDVLAKKRKQKIKIHIEVDTGIGRIGPFYSEAVDFIQRIANLSHIEIEGLFTHFSSADEDSRFTQLQLQRFETVLEDLRRVNITIPIKHVSNSAGIIKYPRSYFDMVRPGLMLYGLYPNDSMKKDIPLKQAMSLKSEIVHLRKVKAGYTVSYGRTFITAKPTFIATVNVGYRSGYSRLCSNRGEVLVHGKRVPIIGRVCMDQLMLDVSTVPRTRLGDEVVFLGKQRKDTIGMNEIAHWSSTISYETACTLGSMNKRLYIQG